MDVYRYMSLPRRYGYIMCACAFAHDFILYFLYWITYSMENAANYAQNATQVVSAFFMTSKLVTGISVCRSAGFHLVKVIQFSKRIKCGYILFNENASNKQYIRFIFSQIKNFLNNYPHLPPALFELPLARCGRHVSCCVCACYHHQSTQDRRRLVRCAGGHCNILIVFLLLKNE